MLSRDGLCTPGVQASDFQVTVSYKICSEVRVSKEDHSCEVTVSYKICSEVRFVQGGPFP